MIGQQFTTKTLLGSWMVHDIEDLLKKTSVLTSISERIDYISCQFLGIPYESGTLIGSVDTEEKLIINLSSVDCFTYVDYVEAMRLSSTYTEFIHNLIRVRYKSESVSFFDRNHFFSDWYQNHCVIDVTSEIGRNKTGYSTKLLNQKADGTAFLPGIPFVVRVIKYIPSPSIDNDMLREFHTGDYIGIFTEAEGLDVSHVGIFISGDTEPFMRHASSVERKVVDINIMEYIQSKPGIVILRPQ